MVKKPAIIFALTKKTRLETGFATSYFFSLEGKEKVDKKYPYKN